MPNAIAMYNQYMGGANRMDQNLGLYRIAIRTKKWWWPLFAFLVEAAEHNACNYTVSRQLMTEESSTI